MSAPKAHWFTPWTIMTVAWALVATLLLSDALLLRDYNALIDAQGLRGAPVSATPLRHTVPLLYADAQTWVLNTLDLVEQGGTRVRFTQVDNAPFGREVHWSSPLVWTLAGAGRLRAAVTGEPLTLAIERSLPWINGALLLALVIALSAWTTSKAGPAAGLLVALGMAGHRDFYDGFSPYYVDHHGLITTAIFGLVLGTVWMGGGWWRHERGAAVSVLPTSSSDVGRHAVISALCGAAGMWISAASIIPAFAFIAVACLGTVLCWGRSAQQDGLRFSPHAWRLWGRVGAGASLFLYIVEYAPANFGFRLEVNHPVYALAWWGGAELIASLSEWHLKLPVSGSHRGFARWVLPLLAIVVAPTVMLFGGVKVFAVRDPFVGQLSNHVLEGMSLPALVKFLGWDIFFAHFNESLLPLIPAVALLFVRDSRIRISVGFIFFASLGFIALACWEVRFWQNASGPQICLALVTLVALTRNLPERTRTVIIIVATVGLFLPTAINRTREVKQRIQTRAAATRDLIPPLHRDLAAAIRASQPEGEVVLLACPTTSTGVAYYGRFKTVGTLYWENYQGLRAAAEIFCASSEDEARARMRARGVTHIVLSTEEDFLFDLFVLLHPGAPAQDFSRTFGYRLFNQQNLPLWLRLMPYAPPPDLRRPDLRVLALQVVPDQTEPEAFHHIAVAQLIKGEPDRAERAFLAGLESSPADQRPAYALSAGNHCYQHGARAVAARLFRAGLAAEPTAALALNLAWLLATDPTDSVRHAADALALAERFASHESQDVNQLNILAAAYAENRRFPEAIAAARRALTLARSGPDATTVPLLERRLHGYEAGQPWRQ